MNTKQLSSINPATSEHIKTYSSHTDAQVSQAINKAHKAYLAWSDTPIKQRAQLLLSIAKEIRKTKEQAATMASLEMGKPIQQSLAEVEKCASAMEYYAANGISMLEDLQIPTEAAKSYVSYQPLGTVFAVMPWNFPYWQVFRAMAPILLSGNAMLLKHASNVCGCAQIIEKILKAANAPTGLFQHLRITNSQVASILQQPSVAALTFTGSTAAGKQLAAIAAANLKKQVLELGGSDAYIILEDANVDLAVQTCFEARLVNTGQSCVAAKRFIVDKKIKKSFEQKMLAKFESATFGNPLDPLNTIGPMARKDLRDELHLQVEKSIQKGARLLTGGSVPELEGAYYPPTLLTNVKKGMPAYDEELFGPVGVIIEAKNETDAMRIANDSPYGLGSAIFSKNKKHAERLGKQYIQAGSCFINAAVHSDPRLPFGGIKNSGYGRELSSFALHEFVNIKTIVVK